MRACLCAQLFREALLGEDFQEIHTPKLIAGASEGGAAVRNAFSCTLAYSDSPSAIGRSCRALLTFAACITAVFVCDVPVCWQLWGQRFVACGSIVQLE